MTDQRCEDCRFWDLWDASEKQRISRKEFCEKNGIADCDSDTMKALIPNDVSNEDRRGSCRRFPPSIRSLDDKESFAFPHAAWDDWCGEWQAKEQKPSGDNS